MKMYILLLFLDTVPFKVLCGFPQTVFLFWSCARSCWAFRLVLSDLRSLNNFFARSSGSASRCRLVPVSVV